jgi:hypothetical protein
MSGQFVRGAICAAAILFGASTPGGLATARADGRAAGAPGLREPAGRNEVDLELVIASDVSTSMDRQEKALQLGGFIAAFRDAEVQQAIMRGVRGRIAVIYVEWGGEGRQRVVVPWTLIDGPGAAAAFADRLDQTYPGRMTFGTAMGEALEFCTGLFDINGFVGDRRVIDISGDGVSNRGRPLDVARAHALARGITINGLPIVYQEPQHVAGDITVFAPGELTAYFMDEVIGGPDSFMVPITAMDAYSEAIRHKLIREIAGMPPGGADFSALR